MSQPAETPALTPKLAPIAYEMTASRRGYIMTFGKLTEHEGRLADLPEVPPSFRPMIGSYAGISKEAARRNNAQMNSGFLDYLYAPEPIAEPVVTA